MGIAQGRVHDLTKRNPMNRLFALALTPLVAASFAPAADGPEARALTTNAAPERDFRDVVDEVLRAGREVAVDVDLGVVRSGAPATEQPGPAVPRQER
jgi:hypothetical protein